MRPSSHRWIPALCAAAFLLPIVCDVTFSGPRRGFGYMASDAYYYLDVARHAVDEGKLAFDGEHATNGFHPLWQLALVPVTAGVELLHGKPHQLLLVVVLCNAAAIAFALYLLSLALARARLDSPLVLLLPVGAYGLLASFVWWSKMRPLAWVERPGVEMLHGTLWSYVNGMESSAVILALALLVHRFVRSDVFSRRRDSLWFGFAAALLCLSRLDHALVAGSILGCAGLAALWRHDRQALLGVTLASSVVLLLFGGYLLSNQLLFGSPVPVSGVAKSSFPHLVTANFDRLRACLSDWPHQGYHRIFRIEQSVVPALVAVLYGAWALVRRQRLTRLGVLLAWATPGVIAIAAYDFLFVELGLHGHWYVPGPVVFVSLALLEVVGPSASERYWALRRPARLVLALLPLALVGASFVPLQRSALQGAVAANFYFNDVPKLHAQFGAQHPKLLENDDGIVSFATGYPAMSGMGLALDPEAARAWQNGQIIRLAVERGFSHVTSLMYWNAYGLSALGDEQLGPVVFSHLWMPDWRAFHYRVDYNSGGFAMIELTRAEKK